MAVALLVASVLALKPWRLWERLFPKISVPVIHALAVLPLQNLSGDPSQDYFAEGLTDALITDLAQISALKLVSRTTVMRYGRPNNPLPQIARELNVDGIVEGTVQRSGGRVRVTAQLIYGPADQHLWANSYERDVGDVLALEADLATAIAHQIQFRLKPEEQQRLSRVRTLNHKALEAYWEGEHYRVTAEVLGLRNVEWALHRQTLQKSIECFERALAEDPDYVPAYLGLWDSFGNIVESHPEHRARAVSALLKALSLDDSNAQAHLDYADFLNRYKWDWTGAEREYKRALQLEPNSAVVNARYAEFLDNVGRLEEGSKQRELAQELDPNIANNSATRSPLIQSPLVPLSVRFDRAMRFAATHRTFPSDDLELGWLLARLGRYQEAVERFEKLMTDLDFKQQASDLRRAYKEKGYQGAMQEWARQAERLAKKKWVPPYWPAEIYVALGEHDRAMAWLEKAYDEHDAEMLALDAHFVWDPLRSDAGFATLLRRVGLRQ
jgi:TolB-like protein